MLMAYVVETYGDRYDSIFECSFIGHIEIYLAQAVGRVRPVWVQDRVVQTAGNGSVKVRLGRTRGRGKPLPPDAPR